MIVSDYRSIKENKFVVAFNVLEPKIVHYEKTSISIAQEFFAGIDKILILGRRLGTRL